MTSKLISKKFSGITFFHPSVRLTNQKGSLSSDVFERRTSTGSELFSLLICLDDIKFVFLNFFTVIEAIWLKICAKLPSKNEKRPLPVNVRRSKTLLLKLPNVSILFTHAKITRLWKPTLRNERRNSILMTCHYKPLKQSHWSEDIWFSVPLNL